MGSHTYLVRKLLSSYIFNIFSQLQPATSLELISTSNKHLYWNLEINFLWIFFGKREENSL